MDLRKVNKILVFVATVAFLPIATGVVGFRKPGRNGWKKALVAIYCLWFFVTWFGNWQALFDGIGQTFYLTGLWNKEFEKNVEGTSMLPTIVSGSSVKVRNPNSVNLKRGDIVAFINDNTEGLSYLKRIVGLPGERVSLKNGQVFVDDKPLTEDYVYKKEPTYGNTFLLDCEEITVPEKKYFVMGDNRTVSWDSRAIGFVDQGSIDGVITRDDGGVVGEAMPTVASGTTLSTTKLIEAINEKRKSAKVNLLVPSAFLGNTAMTRARDLSLQIDLWKKGEMLIDDALDKYGYRYNMVHEYVTFGDLTEQQIVDQIWEHVDEKEKFLSGSFWEMGVGFSAMRRGECSVPVVSVILSWPSVPTYAQETVDYWAREVKVTKEILANLQSWVGFPQKNQEKLKESIALTASMSDTATRIYGKIQSKQWLTPGDHTDMKNYQNQITRNNALMDELFPNVRGIQSEGMPELW